jgi:hypothetical protein
LKDRTRNDQEPTKNSEEPASPETPPEILTKEWQEATAAKSRHRGWIYLDELPFLLADDPNYDDLIPELWTRYQLDLRGPKTPGYDTPGKRIEIWTKLLGRWAFGRVGADQRTETEGYTKLEDIPYIDLHHYDVINGKLERVRDRSGIHGVNYIVKLKDLRKYLIEYLEIPIPEALYPEEQVEREEERPRFPQEISPPLSSPAIHHHYVLSYSGTYWKLTWNGEDIVSKHSGWEYIHYLMLHPKRKFSNTELYNKVHPEIPAEGQAKIQGAEDYECYSTGDFLDLAGRQEMLDPRALLAIKKRLATLTASIDQAKTDGQHYEAAQMLEEEEKLEEILVECQRAGKLKDFHNVQERLYFKIGKAIDRAIKDLPSAPHQHFQQALKPVFSHTKCYSPHEELPWKLQ